MTCRRLLAVVGLVAAAVLLSTGGAVAGSMITGVQIKDGTVTTRDVENHSLVASDLTPSTVRSFARRGPRGLPGLVRGYGLVTKEGVVTRQSGGITVSRPGKAGVYCLQIPGVTSNTTVVLGQPDFGSDSTAPNVNNKQAFVEFGNDGTDCPDGTLSVTTLLRTYTADGSGHLLTTSLDRVDQPFVFVVP